jgi:two-component system KDP operon response regulator KdpE
MPGRILVIDDEPQITRVLRAALTAQAFDVRTANEPEEGLQVFKDWPPDLVITDLMMPGLSGVEVCRAIRAHSAVPILVLSVRDHERSKVEALDAGADDYVTKPFNTDELLARLRVALRRSTKTGEAAVVHAKNLVVDLATRRVTVSGKEVKLSKIEYDLLRLLARHVGKVLTHRQILQEVWGPGHENDTHYLRVYIAHLREKLETNPESPELLLTELGVGYRFIATE